MNLKRMLVWTARVLDTDVAAADNAVAVRTDVVRLLDFDVELALELPSAAAVTTNDLLFREALRDVVTNWMNDSFDSKSLLQGMINSNQTTFETVALSPKEEGTTDVGSLLSSSSSQQQQVVMTAAFTGVSLWERQGQGTIPINPELVELIQRATLLEDNRLLALLQAANDETGLGMYVLNARATIPTIIPNTNNDNINNNNNTPNDNADANLEIIIIIAIVVACVAFLLLLFAVLWAWKTDRDKHQAYGVQNVAKGSLARPPSRHDNGTGSTSDDYDQHQQQPKSSLPHHLQHPNNQHHQHQRLQQQQPPSEIQPQEYPESVISEDISQSLTAYYKSGMMAGYNVPKQRERELNDAASMSSMDSYGYSLDGYAPSFNNNNTTTQMGMYPVGGNGNPMNGQIKDPNGEYEEDVMDTDGDDPDPEYLQDYSTTTTDVAPPPPPPPQDDDDDYMVEEEEEDAPDDEATMVLPPRQEDDDPNVGEV